VNRRCFISQLQHHIEAWNGLSKKNSIAAAKFAENVAAILLMRPRIGWAIAIEHVMHM
jgi:hypothetical protein